MRCAALLALALPTAAHARARAQDACADAAKLFATRPRVGEWAEFQIQRSGGEPVPPLRMAVVGAERREGQQLYRIQMTTTDPKSGQRMISQVLTPWGLDALGGGAGATEFVVKMGNQPAMKM